MNLFGVTSYVEGGTGEANADAAKVPQCPQFRLAGVYATTDLGRPSVTSSGICPGEVDQIRQYFVDTLPAAGWESRSELPAGIGESKSMVMLFNRGAEELSLVLSGSPDGQETLSVGTVAISQPEVM